MSVKGLFYVFIYVSDLERSRKFYGETLGWKLGTNEKEVSGFAFGDAYLIIHADTRTEGKGKYGGGMWGAVKVEGIDAEHAALASKGVMVGKLMDQPWGERQFYFDDPDGYHWSYGEHKGAPK
ncbi:MAG: VOC family protein [Planctomycetes bacterium]|nr:VOC family protein [Planctomycetota bacterium]